MPWSIWQAFARFRKDCQDSRCTVEIVPLVCPTPQIISKERLRETIQKWQGIAPFRKYTDFITSNLEKGKDFTRYVHCEIQILQCLKSKQKLWSEEKNPSHTYIGCSKGSCYICWFILKDQDYRTERSHLKISANYEFPELSPEMKFLPSTVFQLHKEWMQKIMWSAAGLGEQPGEWEQYDLHNDTQPGPSQPVRQVKIAERRVEQQEE